MLLRMYCPKDLNSFKDKISDDIIRCFEYEYEKEGVQYMDIYV